MSKVAEQLIANIKGAGSLDELYSLLTPKTPLKNPHHECVKRINAIQKEYGPNTEVWPDEVLDEYHRLSVTRSAHEMAEAEQFQFEATKRL